MLEIRKFVVTIEEKISEQFEVYADNIEEAMEIAKQKYNNSEFILAPGNLVCKQLQVCDTENNLNTEWNEF